MFCQEVEEIRLETYNQVGVCVCVCGGGGGGGGGGVKINLSVPKLNMKNWRD